MQKFVFTGPECSGKTTICRAVAQHLNTDWVSEYAREYLDGLGRPYEESDLLEIAKGQVNKERSMRERGVTYLLCDTSLLVIKIWSIVKYGRCHPWIEEQLQATPPTLYFLCNPNIPWVEDPLREHPAQRDQLLKVYKRELTKMECPYIFLSGQQKQRQEEVLQILAIYQNAVQ